MLRCSFKLLQTTPAATATVFSRTAAFLLNVCLDVQCAGDRTGYEHATNRNKKGSGDICLGDPELSCLSKWGSLRDGLQPRVFLLGLRAIGPLVSPVQLVGALWRVISESNSFAAQPEAEKLNTVEAHGFPTIPGLHSFHSLSRDQALQSGTLSC